MFQKMLRFLGFPATKLPLDGKLSIELWNIPQLVNGEIDGKGRVAGSIEHVL
jgi:hypothetical protein